MEGLAERDKPTRGQSIHNSVSGNANFAAPHPLPNPSLADLQLAVTAAQNAVTDYEEKLSMLRSALNTRNLAIGNMMLLLNNLAGYVTSVANGDPAIITSAGMFVANDRTPPQPMPQVEGVSIRNTGSEDSLRVEWDVITGAYTYLVECATSLSGPWTQTSVVTAARTEVTGLTPGTRYYLRVRASNPAGLGPWSDVIVKMAG